MICSFPSIHAIQTLQIRVSDRRNRNYHRSYRTQGYFMTSGGSTNACQSQGLTRGLSADDQLNLLPQIVGNAAQQRPILCSPRTSQNSDRKQYRDENFTKRDKHNLPAVSTVATMTQQSLILRSPIDISGAHKKFQRRQKKAPSHKDQTQRRNISHLYRSPVNNKIEIRSINNSLEKQISVLEKRLFSNNYKSSDSQVDSCKDNIGPVVRGPKTGYRIIKCRGRNSHQGTINQSLINKSMDLREDPHLLTPLSQSLNSSRTPILRYKICLPETAIPSLLAGSQVSEESRQISIFQLLQLYIQFHSNDYHRYKLRGNLSTKLIKNYVLLWNRLKAQQQPSNLQANTTINANKLHINEKDQSNSQIINQITKEYFNRIFELEKPGSFLKLQVSEAMRRVKQQFREIAENYQRVPFDVKNGEKEEQQTVVGNNCMNQQDTSSKQVEKVNQEKQSITYQGIAEPRNSEGNQQSVVSSLSSDCLTSEKFSLNAEVTTKKNSSTKVNTDIPSAYPSKSTVKQRLAISFNYKNISQLNQSDQIHNSNHQMSELGENHVKSITESNPSRPRFEVGSKMKLSKEFTQLAIQQLNQTVYK